MCTDANTVEICDKTLCIHTSTERDGEREKEGEREREVRGRGCTHLEAAAAHSTKARVASTAFS